MRQISRVERADVIDAEETLLLRAAGSREASVALAAWAEFRLRVAPGKEVPRDRRLFPAVFRNLSRLGQARDPFLSRAYVESFAFNVSVLRESAEAVRTLSAASVPALVLKGTALLIAHYGDLGIRPMSDADILVPEAQLSDALDALEACGWRSAPSRAWVKTQMHAGVLKNSSGVTIDLHRHALYESRYAAADEGFFADSVAAEVMKTPTRIMGIEDQLIHSIVHGLRWSIAPSGIWILDALMLARSGRVDPEKARARAERLGLSGAVQRGLEVVRSMFGPDDSLDGLLASFRISPTSVIPKVEHWFRVREPGGILGALPNLWFAYLRSAPPGRLGPVGFPAFLAQAWGLAGASELPSMLYRKGLRRLRPKRK